jgi:hypothetical protein
MATTEGMNLSGYSAYLWTYLGGELWSICSVLGSYEPQMQANGDHGKHAL